VQLSREFSRKIWNFAPRTLREYSRKIVNA